MDCFTLFRKSRCACVKDIGHRPLNDMADHCAILPNERINPRFGRAVRAIESSESQKSPVDQPASRCAHPTARTDHPTVGKHATARIEILAFGTGHPSCRQWCSEPVAPNRALYSQHQRFKFASSQPRASVDISWDLPDLQSDGLLDLGCSTRTL